MSVVGEYFTHYLFVTEPCDHMLSTTCPNEQTLLHPRLMKVRHIYTHKVTDTPTRLVFAHSQSSLPREVLIHNRIRRRRCYFFACDPFAASHLGLLQTNPNHCPYACSHLTGLPHRDGHHHRQRRRKQILALLSRLLDLEANHRSGLF